MDPDPGLIPADVAPCWPPDCACRGRRAAGSPAACSVDPLRHLADSAQFLRARCGAVLYRRGEHGGLPGLCGDALLAEGSTAFAVARSFLQAGRPFATFLWPRGGRHAPLGHTRVSVMAGDQQGPTGVLGVVVLSLPGKHRGLTPRELEVLGLLLEGMSNAQIADRLVLAPRTVASHLEHILRKLETATRTQAAVRADREGLYVPAELSAQQR